MEFKSNEIKEIVYTEVKNVMNELIENSPKVENEMNELIENSPKVENVMNELNDNCSEVKNVMNELFDKSQKVENEMNEFLIDNCSEVKNEMNELLNENSPKVENVMNELNENCSEVKNVMNELIDNSTKVDITEITQLVDPNYISFETELDHLIESIPKVKDEIKNPIGIEMTTLPHRNLNLLIKNSCIQESNILIEDRVASILLSSNSTSTVNKLIENKWSAPLDIPIEHIINIQSDKLKKQDNSQKLSVASTLLLEMYRVITSSLLILFVPQSCKGQLCTIHDNMKWNPNHHTYNYGICLNFITLFTFSCLYYIELKRENRLIKYLDVNPDMPSSNIAVQKTLENISIEKRNKILSIDKQYQRISYISIGMFIVNSISSCIIVNRFYLGSQTTTTLITSLLFMFTKLLNVYQVSRTEDHIFYSAYMKTFVQFNDLDKNHKSI